ncbi:MAG: hypothetical protein ACRDZ8_02130 [Acidimicrobiales bacterium]
MTPFEWEQALLRRVKGALSLEWFAPISHFDDVRLERDFPDTDIAFVFRTSNRPPMCQFGYKWGPIGEMIQHFFELQGVNNYADLSPKLMVSVMSANLSEAVDLRLPTACVCDGVTWFD